MKLQSCFTLVGSAVFLGTSLGINIDSATAQVLTLSWSQSGPIAGMNCTRIHEDADIMSWTDNHLCSPPNAAFVLSWSQGGPLPGKACTRIHEDDDIPSWADNYLCMESATTALFPIKGDRDDAVANGRMRTSFTLTSDGRLSAVTNTRTKVQAIGYTGGVTIVLLDESDRLIWASDLKTFGVDGCFTGRCNRTNNWNATVEPERLNQVRGYKILHATESTWLERTGKKGERFLNWLMSDVGQGAAEIVRIVVQPKR